MCQRFIAKCLVLMIVGFDAINVSKCFTLDARDLYRMYQQKGAVEMAANLWKKFSNYLSPSDEFVCMEYPIQKCTCFEMLYQTKSLSPNIPHIINKEIQTSYKISAKFYHPDSNNIPNTYQGAISQPFIFLTECKKALLNNNQRKKYITQLHDNLINCQELGIDDLKCREILILKLNQKYIIDYVADEEKNNEKKFQENNKNNKEEEEEENNKEKSLLLELFLDNSGSMTGESLHKGKNMLHSNSNSLKNKIIQSDTNVYLIGRRSYSKKIIDSKKTTDIIDDNTFDTKIVNNWNANGGQTYLWQFIWENIKNIELGRKCEIIIITDGYDNQSDGAFSGVTGFNEVMKRFTESAQYDTCRVYVLCVSNECSGETGKHYRDLAMGTKGTYCNPDELDQCIDLLNLPYYYRDMIGQFEFDKHVELAIDGKAKMLDWVPQENYNIMKQKKEL